MFARLRQHLNGHILRDKVVLNKVPHEVELDLRRRWEPDLYLLEADIDKQLEHAQLLLQIHRRYERLIAVAEIYRAPARRLCDRFIRPCAVFQSDRLGWLVFFGIFHGYFLFFSNASMSFAKLNV